MLSELLMKMYGAGLMEIDTHPWNYPSKPSERPAVSQLAAFPGEEGARVTSLRHQAVDLDDEAARRLAHLCWTEPATREALIAQSGLDRRHSRRNT